MDNNFSCKWMKRHFKSQQQPFSSSTDYTVEIFKVFRKKKYYESSEYNFEEGKKIQYNGRSGTYGGWIWKFIGSFEVECFSSI